MRLAALSAFIRPSLSVVELKIDGTTSWIWVYKYKCTCICIASEVTELSKASCEIALQSEIASL